MCREWGRGEQLDSIVAGPGAPWAALKPVDLSPPAAPLRPKYPLARGMVSGSSRDPGVQSHHCMGLGHPHVLQ